MITEINVADVSALALGSGILGCGGGGNPYYGMLVARNVIAQTGPVKLIDVEELSPDMFALAPGAIGAPLVGIEKPPSIRAMQSAYQAVKRSLKDRIGAFVAAEVGGSQSMLPLLQSAITGKPFIDGDSMGRAFPELQMNTFSIYGFSPVLPLAISDDHGLLWCIPALPFGKKLKLGGTSKAQGKRSVGIERLLRRYCAYKGGYIYEHVTMDQPSLMRNLVRGSISLALSIGRGVEKARADGGDPVDEILRAANGKRLFEGRVVDVERRFRGGHDWGKVQIDGTEKDSDQRTEISFKNEYLILNLNGETVLTVPDLITVVETQTGAPITTEVLRPGLRVSVIGVRSTPLFDIPEALQVVGPRAFGYDMSAVRLNERLSPLHTAKDGESVRAGP